MATIEIRRFDLGPFGHLYYELINDAGQRIAQINTFGTDPDTGQTQALGSTGDVVRVYDNFTLSGTQDLSANTGTVIFTGSDADVLKALNYIQAFMDFINANSEYIPYGATPIFGTSFNSNSGANTLGEIISLAVSVDQAALEEGKGNGLSNPGVNDDILRGQTWEPILDGETITGSKVTGTAGNDKMNNGLSDDILIGMNGNDLFGSIPPNTYRPSIQDYRGSDGTNTIYGGSESNKVLYDTSDGTDSYVYETGGVDRGAVAFENRWEIITTGDASDTDILYSIEQITSKVWKPETKGDFDNMNGSLDLEDLDSTQLASLQTGLGSFITTAVNAITTGGSTIIGNFGTFVGTKYNDSFVIREIIGRSFDGNDEVDTIDYTNMSNAMTVRLLDETAFITGADVIAGGGVGGPFDELKNIENVIGTQYGDTLSGNGLVNNLQGAAGNDTFFADFGSDTFDGGADIDTIDYTTQDAYEIANSGTGNGIRIEADLVKGTVKRSLINGGKESMDFITNVEKVIGASGDDLFKGKEGVVGQGFTGNGQTTERGDQVDFSDYAATNGGVTVDLGAGTGSDKSSGTYTLTGLEQVIGTGAADSITGDGNDNWLFGNGGDDILINGGDGDDSIIGGAGSDVLEGGGGNDTFYIAASGQSLWVQTGIDTIKDSSGGDDIVYLLGGYKFDLNSFTYAGTQLSIQGAANITNSTDIEFIEYSDGAKFGVSRLILKEVDATTFAASGSILAGDGASNTLTASSGILLVNGNGGDDWLRGFDSNDLTLDGGAGSDYLFGFSGNTLNGGAGNDYLDGQLNNNVKYQAGSGIDVIKDGGANGNLEISSAFTLWRADNGSLVVDYSGATTPDEVIASTNKVIVLDQFNGGGIETINGGAISIDTIAQLGTSIDDFLQGDGANDVFAASKGYDIYDGGAGANTFSFAANDTGSTVIRTTPDTQADLLIFNGLNQSDVSVIRDASIGTDNLLFSYGQSFAIVENAVLDILNADNINVQFADTSALTFASIDLTTRGSNQADTLDGDVPGFSVDDIIFGGAGDDVIKGLLHA